MSNRRAGLIVVFALGVAAAPLVADAQSVVVRPGALRGAIPADADATVGALRGAIPADVGASVGALRGATAPSDSATVGSIRGAVPAEADATIGSFRPLSATGNGGGSAFGGGLGPGAAVLSASGSAQPGETVGSFTGALPPDATFGESKPLDVDPITGQAIREESRQAPAVGAPATPPAGAPAPSVPRAVMVELLF